MKFEQPDDLDSLLFSLPLEEPPADLRASILASTIYRPPFPIKAWEASVLGALAAVIVWLCVMIAQGGADAFLRTAEVFGLFFAHALSTPGTLVWISLGGGVAFLLMILNLAPMPVGARNRYSRR